MNQPKSRLVSSALPEPLWSTSRSRCRASFAWQELGEKLAWRQAIRLNQVRASVLLAGCGRTVILSSCCQGVSRANHTSDHGAPTPVRLAPA